jgi:hypothetical protein
VAKTERFNIGFLLLDKLREDLFLSVTPGFEHGPGIQRDGITPPRMRDPHSVPRIMNPLSLPLHRNLRPTTDPYAQRAGTWPVCSKHQSEPIPAFDSSLNVPEESESVVKRGLSKNRDQRPADALQLSQDLQTAYAHFSDIRMKAALAETVEEQKIKESELIPGLTRTDTLALKISCELALKTGHSDVIETSKILEALQQIGFAELEVWESLELLNERGYIAAHRLIGGGMPFQVYSLEPSGFHAYAKIFIPDYNALINRVIHAIGVNELDDNFAISEALDRPVLLIDFILDLLENNGLLTQSKRFGGKSVISRVTVELKRRARENVSQ